MAKDFLTYDEQIKKMREKGIIVYKDEEKTVKAILKTKGYFNIINAYKEVFCVENNRYKNVQFDYFHALYRFDENLRKIFSNYILDIEVQIKSLIAHYFSSQYGIHHIDFVDKKGNVQKSYLNRSNFKISESPKLHTQNKVNREVTKIIKKCNNILKNSEKNYITYYKNQYNKVPLWVLMNELSIGKVSMFYSSMKTADKNAVADYFRIKQADLNVFLRILVNYRNKASHNERMFCGISSADLLSENLSLLNSIETENFTKLDIVKPKLLSVIIILKYLLPEYRFKKFWLEFILEIEDLRCKITPKYYNIILDKMNLNGKWRNIVDIKKSTLKDVKKFSKQGNIIKFPKIYKNQKIKKTTSF